MKRWRLLVALAAALAAVPLLAIDNVSSAEGRASSAKVAVLATSERPDLALSLLASRASSWAVARETSRQDNLNEAISLAQQVRVDEAARLAEEARVATEAAMRGEQTKQAEAARKANEAARQAAATAAARRASTTTAKPEAKTATTVRQAGSSSDPTPEQWHKLRQCESANNYRALSSGGRFRGAYQFSQPTWDWVAGQVAPQLVGVDPIDAAPGDQDNMALNLYRMRGAGQWPVCGRFL